MNKTSLLELTKKWNIPRWNCKKTKEELEKAIQGTITKYKDEQVIDKKVYDQKLMDYTLRKLAWDGLQKNMVIDGDVIIDKRTGEV